MILVTAEAGYGKTTLLADFARGTKQRILWYRIDEDDSNWVKCEVCSASGSVELQSIPASGRPGAIPSEVHPATNKRANLTKGIGHDRSSVARSVQVAANVTLVDREHDIRLGDAVLIHAPVRRNHDYVEFRQKINARAKQDG